MWLSLQRGAVDRLALTERQSIWPAPDGTDAELVIITEVLLDQEIILATPRLCRVSYRIVELAASMVLGDAPPAPWPEASHIAGHNFELMLTERGALVVPSQGPKLPNRLRSWLETVAEDLRSCWPVPPENIQAGSEWSAMPAVPGGLPPGTTSATVKVSYKVADVEEHCANIDVKFGVRVSLESRGHPKRGEGRGQLSVHLEREDGVESAARVGTMQIIRPHSRTQVLRSTMELRRQ